MDPCRRLIGAGYHEFAEARIDRGNDSEVFRIGLVASTQPRESLGNTLIVPFYIEMFQSIQLIQ